MRQCTISDDHLMQAAAGGDEDAFAALVQRHRRWVCWLIQTFVGDSDQAEDLTQEAFSRVYRHRGDYTAQGTFGGWLKRIAVNLAKDHLRKRKQAEWVSLHEYEEILMGESPIDPMAALASGVLKEEVRAAIQSLPDEQRVPVVMRYFGDMEVQDIAWALRCPVGTVKSRLFYGLHRVRQSLTARWEREEG